MNLVRGLYAMGGHSRPPSVPGWITKGVSCGTVHMGAAVNPEGTDDTECGVSDSTDDSGCVGHGCCQLGVVGTGFSVTGNSGFPVRRSRMNRNPVLPACAIAGVPFSVNSAAGGVES